MASKPFGAQQNVSIEATYYASLEDQQIKLSDNLRTLRWRAWEMRTENGYRTLAAADCIRQADSALNALRAHSDVGAAARALRAMYTARPGINETAQDYSRRSQDLQDSLTEAIATIVVERGRTQLRSGQPTTDMAAVQGLANTLYDARHGLADDIAYQWKRLQNTRKQAAREADAWLQFAPWCRDQDDFTQQIYGPDALPDDARLVKWAYDMNTARAAWRRADPRDRRALTYAVYHARNALRQLGSRRFWSTGPHVILGSLSRPQSLASAAASHRRMSPPGGQERATGLSRAEATSLLADTHALAHEHAV